MILFDDEPRAGEGSKVTEQFRRVAHFSCGAASAIATKISNPDVIWYAATGSEDPDNHRFMLDCQEWFGKEVKILRNPKYSSTWDLWEKRRYIAGISGAPCTGELKVKPQAAVQRPDDIHIFGYTYDKRDIRRAELFKENWPELRIETPLIDRKINKNACLALLDKVGIARPRTYALGFPHANCIPCPKAGSPSYWALVRHHYPDEFNRMTKLSRKLGVKLTRIKGVRVFIDEIPKDHKMTEAEAPACDMMCQLVEKELYQTDV